MPLRFFVVRPPSRFQNEVEVLADSSHAPQSAMRLKLFLGPYPAQNSSRPFPKLHLYRGAEAPFSEK